MPINGKCLTFCIIYTLCQHTFSSVSVSKTINKQQMIIIFLAVKPIDWLFNPFMPYDISQPYQLDEAISNLKT